MVATENAMAQAQGDEDTGVRSISLVETFGRFEHDLADTLRAMAANDRAAAARRLKLADAAARGEQAATGTSNRLRQQAVRHADRADAAALSQALEHAGMVLVGLARAEDDIAGILSDLARHGRPDLVAEREHLVDQASDAAQHARDLAHALLAHIEVDAETAERTPAGIRPDEPRPRQGFALDQRLADIDKRLADLRQANCQPSPGDDQAPRRTGDVQWHLQQAQRHCRESAAHLAQTRQLAVDAFERAACAHDRAAEAFPRSTAADLGDEAEHERSMAFHRAAAQADRQYAQQIRK